MSNSNLLHSAITLEEMATVSPALAKYTQESIINGVWKRPELSVHDRSIVTLSALIESASVRNLLPSCDRGLM